MTPSPLRRIKDSIILILGLMGYASIAYHIMAWLGRWATT